jgi:ATP-dependent Clp protease, protease subunit
MAASISAFVPLGASTFLSVTPTVSLQQRRTVPRVHALPQTGRPRAAPVVRARSDLTSASALGSVWDVPCVPRSAVARGPQPNKKPPVPVPTVSFGDSQMDVFSRLAKDRILVLGRQVDDETANQLVAQMLFLSAEDPTKDITLYINSPGGSVSAGLAIFDTMQYIPCDVATICFGTAASMGAFLLCSGKKGKRKSLPNARIMIHQPLGGAQGQAADIEIQAKEILFIRSLLNGYLANATGQPVEKVRKDSDRDFFMTPEEAVEYGMIDEVIKTRRPLAKPAMPVIK